MKDMTAVILAAGKGTRMRSGTPKVLHEVLGRPMLRYVIDAVKGAGISNIIVVIGHGSAAVRDLLKTEGVTVVEQKKLLGSGDAVMTAKKALGSYAGDILVICGDTPLIRKETVQSIIEKHKSSGASATILTAILKDPTGYGRIVRGSDGRITKIVEDQEASLYEEVIEEINVGTYCFRAADLFAALGRTNDDNKKKEYFLTDAIGVFHRNNKPIESATAEDKSEIIGINSRKDLACATQIMKARVLDGIMAGGVTVQDPLSTVIYPDVSIGQDTVIYSNTVIQSDVTIGSSCKIGPFARIRPGVVIGDRVEVGNFVELVKTRIGDDTKVKHHTYLGNATVGKKVNVGAGTITANFNGRKKSETIIEDGAFIGVGAIFVAPVKVGKEAVVGAGCVVLKNHDVPRKATAVGVPSRILKKK